jgi:hypothetical protein
MIDCRFPASFAKFSTLFLPRSAILNFPIPIAPAEFKGFLSSSFLLNQIFPRIDFV